MSQHASKLGGSAGDLLLETSYARGEPVSWEVLCGKFEVRSHELRVGKYVRGHGRAMRIEGKRPGCDHQLSKEISPLAQGALFAPPRPAEGAQTYVVTCNCVSQHPGAPDGVRGCGAQGGVTVTPKGSGWEVVYANPTVSERDADEWAERARLEQLPRVRALAAQWMAVWGVIAGLITFGTIFDADERIYGLTSPSSAVYVATAGLSLAAAVLAVVFASQAAGLRELDDIPADVAGRVELQVAMVAYCRSRLTQSRIFAMCSVILVAGALGLRFFG